MRNVNMEYHALVFRLLQTERGNDKSQFKHHSKYRPINTKIPIQQSTSQ